MVSCTRLFLYKFLAPNTAQLYCIQETCMHVTRMVSSDWSAAYRCHCFHFSSRRFAFASYFSVFRVLKLQQLLQQLPQHLYQLVCHICYESFLYKNLHELAGKFDARNLRKKVVEVSCARFLTVCRHHYCVADVDNNVVAGITCTSITFTCTSITCTQALPVRAADSEDDVED